MSTMATITAQLQTLINNANNKTGNSDIDLTTAVESLIAGYRDDYLAIRCNGTGDTWEYISELVTNIAAYSFYYTSLSKIVLPNCITIEGTGRQFQGCTDLINVSLPKVQTTGECMFMQCLGLENIVLPALNADVKKQAFMNCASLLTADLGNCTSIGANVFNGCSFLEAIVLRNEDNVVTLTNVNAFTNTEYSEGGNGGVVYVPSNLISSYQSATNWSVLYEYGTVTFQPIEGSEFE